ncbi:hypothetical protein NUKP62_34620 [Klebsiella variicola]|nr:hypothetical protein NUKP62_34620 [Klebsiella variicola]
MWISIRRSQAVLLALLAMGGAGLRRYALVRCRAAAGGSVPRPRPANAVAPGDGIAHACR